MLLVCHADGNARSRIRDVLHPAQDDILLAITHQTNNFQGA
jgi:hypothetical protein